VSRWLANVPRGWDGLRLKYCVHQIDNKVEQFDDSEIYVGLENVEPWTGTYLASGTAGLGEGTSNRFKAGDVLFGKLRPYLAKCLLAPFNGVCTSELLVLRPTLIEARYLQFLMLSREWIEVVNSSTYGAKMPRASWGFIGNLQVPVPSADEQRSIADFLSHETARIDELVAKKERLIELLGELHLRVIDDLIVPSCGIPSDWPTLGRYVVSMCDGPFGSDMKSSHYADAGIRLIRLQNIRRGFFDNNDQAFIAVEHFHELPGHDARPGDVLVAGLGDPNNPVGRACLLPAHVELAMVKADCFRVRMDERRVKHNFVSCYLNSDFARAEIGLQLRGATRERMNLSGLCKVRLPTPALDVQTHIVDQILASQKKTDHTSEVVRKAINKLREYRTALISAAVIGQIDVNTYRKEPEAVLETIA
jgi:type I restriction enzyme S subunit